VQKEIPATQIKPRIHIHGLEHCLLLKQIIENESPEKKKKKKKKNITKIQMYNYWRKKKLSIFGFLYLWWLTLILGGEKVLNLTLDEMWIRGFRFWIKCCTLLALISAISAVEPELGSTRVVFQVFPFEYFMKLDPFLFSFVILGFCSKSLNWVPYILSAFSIVQL